MRSLLGQIAWARCSAEDEHELRCAKSSLARYLDLATVLSHRSLDSMRIYGQHSTEYLASPVARFVLIAYAE